MNSMKRKSETTNNTQAKRSNLEAQLLRLETVSDSGFSCGEESDSTQQESDNGGSSDLPVSSNVASTSETDNKKSEDAPKDPDDQTSESTDRKLAKSDSSKPAGTLLFFGGTNWDLIGRKELPKNAKDAVGANLWGPHTLSSLKGIRIVGAYAGPVAVHSVIVSETGQTYTWGRNDKGQLGLGDTKRRDVPTLVETFKDQTVIDASCGRGHTLFLTDSGTVYSCGDNKFGQCGVGSQNNNLTIPTKITFKGRSIAKVACGAEFSMIADQKGALFSFGCPEFGQLGHNSDGRYFVTSTKLAFRCELVPRRVIAFIEKTREGHVTLIDDVHIMNVACGVNHSVAVDSKGRCYSFGFGGYGRLGHAEQKDEMVPRLIKTFDGPATGKGVKNVFAGATFSMAINIHDVLYFWGQNRRSGEANMYPKPVPDLVGWSVKDVGCSYTSIICIADESVIAWGPSPTHGELGYGETKPKSSTTPQEVRPLEGVHSYCVTMGHGHTLLIARDETDDDKKKLEQFPEYTP